MSEEHKLKYIYLKGLLRYFRLPIILLSGINSVISVGLQPYIEQSYISVINCIISLGCGIIGSIELFLGIQKRLETDLISSREYYLLSVDIFKTLTLNRENRPIPAKDYLEKSYNTYIKLIENSEALVKKIEDQLNIINIDKHDDIIVMTPTASGRVDLPSNNVDLNIDE
jgi:hypothetical protein